MQIRMAVGGVVLALLLWSPLAGPPVLEAQVTGPDGRWPLQPGSPGGRTLAPFMEGWYENEDGSFSISFGYLNLNDDTLYIPVGEDNFLEPAQFNGMQPTVFHPGHQRGVFTATLPAVMRDTDVWWTLTKANGEVTRVPGRIGAVAYQLDWRPRPHGSLPPSVSFDGQDGEGRGPPGIWSERTMTTSVGSPITLSVNTSDPSERDESDFRFEWCGPSSRARDPSSSRGTSPTRSPRWRRMTTAPLPLLDKDVPPPDPRPYLSTRAGARPA